MALITAKTNEVGYTSISWFRANVTERKEMECMDFVLTRLREYEFDPMLIKKSNLLNICKENKGFAAGHDEFQGKRTACVYCKRCYHDVCDVHAWGASVITIVVYKGDEKSSCEGHGNFPPL